MSRFAPAMSPSLKESKRRTVCNQSLSRHCSLALFIDARARPCSRRSPRAFVRLEFERVTRSYIGVRIATFRCDAPARRGALAAGGRSRRRGRTGVPTNQRRVREASSARHAAGAQEEMKHVAAWVARLTGSFYASYS